MKRNVLIFSTLSGALAVALGAMGAHVLNERIEASQLQVFETAVRYQMYHTLALIAFASLHEKLNGKFLSIASYLFVVGIILFSGSLYFLSTRTLFNISGCSWAGIITPFGGLAFIAGWIFTLISILSPPPPPPPTA